MGGEETRMCTSSAPAARTISTILRLVVPRTMESSTSTTRLPCERRPVGAVLQLHAEVADLVRRLDEGAADIVVADDAELEGDARLRGVAHGRRHAAVGHRHHHIGRHAALARQLGADALARLVDRRALHHAVGAGEVDVLEDAEAALVAAEGLDAVHARAVDDDDLARLDVAHELGADDVEGAGLAGQHPARPAFPVAGTPPSRPSTSGRTPSGSRAPISAPLCSATRL